jgi:RNA polymerase sigma-70 factor, ECF subfamily
LANDDHNARFDTVVTPHLEDAYSLARWLTRSRADADDVLQEACIRALGAIRQHKGENSRAWVLAIVRGKEAEVVTDPESEMIARADAKQLETLIAALPIEFRETLVLRDLQGLGYREISEVIGIPVGTVMSRLARARQRLIAAIKEGSL